MTRRVVALMPGRREDIRAIHKLWTELGETLGAQTAEKLLCEAINAENSSAGRRAARTAEVTSESVGLNHFVRAFETRKADGGLELEEATIEGDSLTLKVSRCDYPTLYHCSPLPTSMADLLCCGAEKAFAEGYDHRLELSEISASDDQCTGCTLTYRWNEGAKPAKIAEPKKKNRVKLKLRQ